VTSTVTPQTSTPLTWDEPVGVAARGTLVVLIGRGESPTSYARFGRRISADAYRVRVVDVDLDDLATAGSEVRDLLADVTLPRPFVLVGADTGAALATVLAADTVGIDAVVLAGLALPGSASVGDWDAELEARTACPAHRRAITEDPAFERGSLSRDLPAELADVDLPALPTLLLHGSEDPITPVEMVLDQIGDASQVRGRVVVGGRHDVLNDVSHRSVAATVVLFLESLKLGADLPDIVRPAHG
jgi:alpha-beta hydrolase superfamily lysophospholipase